MYPVKDQHLLVGPYALTKKQCDKDVMALEIGFLSALLGSPTWDLVNDDLVIKGPRGAAAGPLALIALAPDAQPTPPARRASPGASSGPRSEAPLVEGRQRRAMADRDERRVGQRCAMTR